MKEGGKNWRDCHPRQVVDNVGKSFLMEKVDTGMCLGNGSLHGCCIDRGDVGRTEAGVGEANGTVDSEKMT